MQPFPDTELVINPDGSIYHLGIRPEHVADTVIVVGDPDRVTDVSHFLDKIHYRKQKREFVTHFGEVNGKNLTIISSGIGTDNVEILMHELDALVNIDLSSRLPKAQHKRLNIIRLGTSGSMQPDLACDTLMASEMGLGLDVLLQFYHMPKEPVFTSLTKKIQTHTGLPFEPYMAAADATLLRQYAKGLPRGATVTTPGFYAPQGRVLRYELTLPYLLKQLATFPLPQGRFTNFEMETAAYYALGNLLGHRMLSLNALLANRVNGTFSSDPHQTVHQLISHFFDCF